MTRLAAAPTIGPVAATPTTIPVSVSTKVTFTAQVTDPTTSVDLLRLDAAGRPVGIAGTMRDDGTNGDPVASDRSFTLPLILNPTAPGATYYRVSVAFKGVSGRVMSPVITVTASAPSVPPSIAVALSPAPNAAGWNNGPVTATFTCTPGSAAIASCPSPIVTSAEGAGQSVSGTVADTAGATASTTSAPFSIDSTAPVIQASTTSAPGGGLAVAFTCTDALSGVAVCPSTQTASPGGPTSIHVQATDVAGNIAALDVPLVFDTAPPAIVPTAAPPANANGWNNTDVVVSFACSDAESGIAQCPSPFTVTADGAGQVVSGTATDQAGNTASASVTISLDRTAPVVTVTAPLDGAVLLQTPAHVTGTAADALSGLAGVSCNGVAAAMQGSLFSCDVPLATGATGIAVVATDKAGNAATQTITVTLGGNHQPTAAPGGPYTGETGKVLTFNGAASNDPDGDPLTYTWDFGDGQAGSGISPTHTYQSSGTFVVKLTVKDSHQAVATATTSAVIAIPNRAPVADAGGPYSAAVGSVITFSAAGSTDPDGDALTHHWQFSDGASATGVNPRRAFQTAGSFGVVLTSTDARGLSSTATATVTIAAANQPPSAKAGGPYSADAGATIAFSAAGSSDPDGDPLTYSWSFGDGASASGSTPSHAYVSAGQYTAIVTVNDGRGGSASASASVAVANANRVPTAQAGGPYAAKVGETIHFDASGSSDPDGDPLTFAWAMGDGRSRTGAQPAYAYTAAGTYTALLTVTDSHNASHAASATVVITDPTPAANRAPVANAGGPYTGEAGLPITFDASLSSDADNDALTYQWTFGDGASASGKQVTHVFSSANTYSATLAVTDVHQATAQAAVPVTVTPPVDRAPPLVTLSAPASVLPGTDVSLVATATDNVSVTKVRFEVEGFPAQDAATAPYQHTIHIPDIAVPGATLLARATAFDAAGNTAEDAIPLTIASKPDTSAPSLTLQHPADTAPGAELLLLAIADDEVGVASVTFTVNGQLLHTDTTAPFEFAYLVSATVTPGTQLTVVADATDYAGNTTRQSGSVPVTASPDTTPPAVTLAGPAQARSGDTIALVATATDQQGIAAVAFLSNGAAIGAASQAPYELAFTLPAGLPPGTQVHLEARATDFSGQEATASHDVLIVSDDASAGLVIGEVFDDVSGLPLAGATAAAATPNGDVEATTDARGRFALSLPAGNVRVRIARAGWTEVFRVASVQPGQVAELFDARLAPVLTVAPAMAPVLGGTATDADATLTVPGGALASAASIALAHVGPHALEGLTPLGWAPVSAHSIEPHATPFLQPATLDVAVPSGLTAGTALTLARWDESTAAWVAVAQHLLANGDTRIVAQVSSTGQYVWLRPDVAPAAPPAPQVGAPLAGVAPVPPDAAAAAVVTPQPAVLFYQPGIHSDVKSEVTPATTMPSGTPLQARISEKYEFKDGSSMRPMPLVEDFAFFQNGPALTAAYAVTPTLPFQGDELEVGTISVDVVTPGQTAAMAIVGSAGAHLALGTGEALDVLPETGGVRSVQIDRFDPAALGIPLPAGLSFLGGITLSMNGAPLTAPASFSITRPGSVPNGAQILLLEIADVAGQTEFVLRGLGMPEPARVTAAYVLPKNQFAFEGIRTSGRYLFAQATVPLGFSAGQVLDPSSGPLAGARVSVNGFGVIALSHAAGYIVAGQLGTLTMTARDLVRSDEGTVAAALGATGDELALDIQIVAVPPRVVSIQPTQGAQQVPLFSPITVVFSKPIDATTAIGANPSRFSLASGSTAITGTVSLSSGNTVATFWPVSPLASNTPYTFTIAPGITDVAGRPLQNTAPLAFSTLDVAPPQLPAAGAVTASIPDAGGFTTVRATQGTVGLHDIVTIENVTTGAITPVLVDPNGGFTVTVAAALQHLLRLHIVSPSNLETIYALPTFSQTNPDGSVTAAIGATGGRVDGPGGTFAEVKSGTFPAGALVTLRQVPETSFPIQLDAAQKAEFNWAGGVEIDFGGATPEQYVNVGVATSAGDTVDNQWIVAQAINVAGQPALSVVDTAKLIAGSVRTSSPPCPGVTAAGVYGFYRAQHSVGLNYAQMYASQYGGLRVNVVIPFMTPAFAFPFAAFSYDVPQPVCFPVLTGRVTVVPNTQHIRIAPGKLAPADREIVVKNALAGTESHFPRNLLEMKFAVAGAKTDSFTVLLEAADGSRVPATGVTIVPRAAGQVDVGVDADSITSAITKVIVQNTTTSVETQFGAAQMAITLPVAGGATDFYIVSALDSTGAARQLAAGADFVLQSPNGAGNLAAKAVDGTIDPTLSEILAWNAAHPNDPPLSPAQARVKVELIDEDPGHGWTVEIPAASIVNGGFSFPFDGLLDDSYAIQVSYASAPSDYQKIPKFRIVVSNPTTGQVIKTITTQAPPRDEPLNLGTITDDAVPPMLTSSPSRLDNFDPSAPLTFTFSEAMDPNSIKAAAIVEKLVSAGGNTTRIRVAGEWRIYNNGRTATFVPAGSLEIGAEYSITFLGGDALNTSGLRVTDAGGNAIGTTRLSVKTFTPRLVATLNVGKDGRLIEPMRDIAFERRTVNNQLRTFLFATTESRTGYKLLSIDATDVEHPAELNSAYGGQGKKRITLVPDIGKNGNAAITYREPIVTPPNGTPVCGAGAQFAGDMAITTSVVIEYSYLSFFDVTDPTTPCLIGNKLLNATPDFLNSYTQPGTVHQMGFAEGVSWIRHNSGVAAYAAVREVGIMAAEIGTNLPEPNPQQRQVESVYPGDYWDVVTVNDRLFAAEKSAGRIDLLDPNLARLASVALPDEPRRLLFAKAFGTDEDEDGLITPAEQRDLLFAAGNRSIQIVDVTHLTAPTVIGQILMSGPVRDLDIDVDRHRLFAGGSWSNQGGGDGFFIIDLSKPAAPAIDADGDGWDDRVVYKRQYPQTITGFRVDVERGVAYIPTYPDNSAVYNAGPGRLDLLALYDLCCDLGVDFTTKADTQRARGDRAALLAKEKEALQKGIAAGLDAAGVSCTVPAGITMIEQGSGACLWRGDCGSNYQPGLSDHDFEVFVPNASFASAGACVVKALNETFIDPLTGEPKPIVVSDGSAIAFEDITFFPVVKERFESATFDVMPPSSGGSDAVGDMGLGRRSLLLKWLLEGAYVTGVPGHALDGRSLDAILEDLKRITGIPPVEGLEWSVLQDYNLAKSKAFVRVVGASDPASSFNGLFVKQMHDAGKAGIRAAMARMVANAAANRQMLNVTRASYTSNACLAVVATIVNPNNWKEKPCTSFEEYVASAAARTLRGTPIGLFTLDEVVNQISRFYKVKADLERVVTDVQADAFAALAAQFIAHGKAETKPVYDLNIAGDPDAVQRTANLAQAQTKIAGALASAKLTLSPRIYNRGFRSGQDIRIAMYTSDAPGTGTLVKEIRQDIPGGDDRTITWAHNPDGSLALSNGQAVPLFKLDVDQTSGFGAPHGVSFVVDLPDRSVNEANRQNNVGGFFYYVIDRISPQPVSTPATPYLPIPGNNLLDPDASCAQGPTLTMTQTLSIGGQPLLGEASVGFGETVTITLTAQNFSADPAQDVIVCSNITNQCYNLGIIGAGQSKSITVDFTAPVKGLIVDGPPTVYTPSSGIIEGNATRLVIGCESFAIVPLPYNPATSEVQMGGSAFRYYRIVNKRTGVPVVNATVTAEVTGTFTGGVTKKTFTFTTGPQGEIRSGNETGLKLTPDQTWLSLAAGSDYTVTITSVNGVSPTCAPPEQFTLSVKPREYSLAYSRGTEIKGSAGLLFSAEVGAEAGMEIEQEINGNTGATSLSIGASFQTSGQFGVEFSLFKLKGGFGVGQVSGGAKIGTTDRRYAGKGVKLAFPYPLDADEQCAIANLTLTGMLHVHPLLTKLVELARTRPCADPATYVVSSSTEFGNEANESAGVKFNFGRPAPGFGSADKEIGVDFGVSASNGFGIGTKYVLGYTPGAPGALPGVTSTTESYTLKGGIDYSAGLSLMPQDAPGEAGEKDEAGEIEGTFFKQALGVQGSFAGTTSYGVSFITDLTKLRPDLKPNAINISYAGPKNWGWKRDLLGAEQNLGNGFTGVYSYTLDTPELVDKAIANLANLDAIHQASARTNMANQRLQLTPTILNSELGTFSQVFYDTPIAYSVSKETGSGFTAPFGLEGSALGLKLGAGIDFKSESKVGWTKEKGVRLFGRNIKFEDYGNTPPAQPDLGLWDTIKTTWQSLLASFATDFSDVNRHLDNTSPAPVTMKSNFTATLVIDPTTLAQPVDARLFSWRFTPVTVPATDYRYMPGDSAGRGDQPHYGIGGFHQFAPDGLDLGAPRTLVIDYHDQDVVGLDESTFRIYAWNTSTLDWDDVGGVVDTVANTVTTTVNQFRLYTIAPSMPARTIGLSASGGSVIGTDDTAKRRFTMTATGFTTNTGQPVPDGTLYTVRSAPADGSGVIPLGSILATDADPATDGVQLPVSGGAIQFDIEYDSPFGAFAPARAIIYSTSGTAFGELVLTVPAGGVQ